MADFKPVLKLNRSSTIFSIAIVASLLSNIMPVHTEAAGSWASGAAYIKDDSFGNWRGEAGGITGCWADSDDGNQRNAYCMADYPNWSKDMDLAPGMIVRGESLVAAGNGAYEGRWRQAMSAVRNNWGRKQTVYIRPAHEMNGNWYPWSVTAGNATDFKKAWVRYYNIIQQELVQKGYNAKVTFNVNKDPVNAVPLEQYWPGDQYVDVYGVDFYDMYPSYFSQGDWDSHYSAVRSGSPYGIGAHQAFARAHGKPMAFPEWGANAHQISDNPYFIEKMNGFMRSNAGSGAGQVLYDVYFNTWDQVQIYPSTRIPNVAAKYRSMTWGAGGTATTLPTTPTPVATATPKPTIAPTPIIAPVSIPFRLDSGSDAAYSDTKGLQWSADKFFTMGDAGKVGGTTSVGNQIGGTVNQKLYKTERWAIDTYSIPVANGSYTVKLHFAEIGPDSGERTFSVLAEGKPWLTDFNIMNKAGGAYIATIESKNISVSDGYLSIDFNASKNATSIAGIEIVPLESSVKAGDLNQDGKVNAIDLSLVLSKWGTAGQAGDVNGDKVVNALDLSILLSNWST